MHEALGRGDAVTIVDAQAEAMASLIGIGFKAEAILLSPDASGAVRVTVVESPGEAPMQAETETSSVQLSDWTDEQRKEAQEKNDQEKKQGQTETATRPMAPQAPAPSVAEQVRSC